MTDDISIVVFDGFDEIDVFGPFEILSSAGFSVRLAALAPGPVTSMRGIGITVTDRLEAADGIVVPGGGWLDRAEAGAWAEVRRGELTDRLCELAADAHWLASVCSGGMILASAGLLRGRMATTNRACFDEFRPHVGQLVDTRVVDDGDRITAGALFAGVDLALWITERERGRAAADAVAAGVEYVRQGEVWRSGSQPAGTGGPDGSTRVESPSVTRPDDGG